MTHPPLHIPHYTSLYVPPPPPPPPPTHTHTHTHFRYIYHLAQLHKDSGNWVEAGFTLLLHAQLLQVRTYVRMYRGCGPLTYCMLSYSRYVRTYVQGVWSTHLLHAQLLQVRTYVCTGVWSTAPDGGGVVHYCSS